MAEPEVGPQPHRGEAVGVGDGGLAGRQRRQGQLDALHVLGQARIPRRVAEHEVVRPGPFGPSARRDEHLTQPYFGAPAQLHVPRAERPVLLPGPPQRTQVGQNSGKLRIAEA